MQFYIQFTWGPWTVLKQIPSCSVGNCQLVFASKQTDEVVNQRWLNAGPAYQRRRRWSSVKPARGERLCVLYGSVGWRCKRETGITPLIPHDMQSHGPGFLRPVRSVPFIRSLSTTSSHALTIPCSASCKYRCSMLGQCHRGGSINEPSFSRLLDTSCVIILFSRHHGHASSRSAVHTQPRGSINSVYSFPPPRTLKATLTFCCPHPLIHCKGYWSSYVCRL